MGNGLAITEYEWEIYESYIGLMKLRTLFMWIILVLEEMCINECAVHTNDSGLVYPFFPCYCIITEKAMKKKMTMIYWKSEKFWLGKLLDHPEIMTQGETLEELEENIKDVYRLMLMDDVPEKHKMKEISL